LSNEISTFDNLPKLIYTKRGIDETLHLYPPVWLFTRRGVSEDHISCYYVAQQTDIIIVLYFVHRRPEFWEAAAAPRGRTSCRRQARDVKSLRILVFDGTPALAWQVFSRWWKCRVT
jgi:cytochrome P450